MAKGKLEVVGEEESGLHWVDAGRYFDEHENGVDDSFMVKIRPEVPERNVFVNKLLNHLYVPDLELVQVVFLLLELLLLVVLFALFNLGLLLLLLLFILLAVSILIRSGLGAELVNEIDKETDLVISDDGEIFDDFIPVLLR